MSGNAVKYRLGRNCKLYEGTAGAEAATEVTHAADVTLNGTREKIDVTDRLLAQTGFKGYEGGLIDATVTIQARKVKADAVVGALKTAFQTGGAISLKILNGSDGDGVKGDFIISDYQESQPVNGAVDISITAYPTITNDSFPPTWINENGSSAE